MKTKLKPRLGFDAFEPRLMMAGDVAVALEGSLLTVYGDDLANQVAITQNAAGDVTIQGQLGTSINGLPSVTLINPNLNSADVRLNGGNDRLTVTGLRVATDLNLDLGAGADTASITANVGANLSLLGGGGADTATLRGAQTGGDLFVDLGLDAGRATLQDSVFGGNASVISDAAADTVFASNLRIGGDFNVETKEGNDTLTLRNVTARTLTAVTDKGDDVVSVSDVRTVEDISIETGDGRDRVTLTRVNSGKSLKVTTDAGADTVVATSVAAAIDAIFEGGADQDSFDNNGVTAGVKFEVKEFEILT